MKMNYERERVSKGFYKWWKTKGKIEWKAPNYQFRYSALIRVARTELGRAKAVLNLDQVRLGQLCVHSNHI